MFSITHDFSLAKLMTFEQSKQFPIHNWFYYKEGYSPEIISWVLQKEAKLSAGKYDCRMLVDPFCGVGTSLLAAKHAGIPSRGSIRPILRFL